MPLPSQCDHERLRRSLQDRLSEPEQEALALHLEACEACRDDLERMAAATGFWGEARLLKLGPEPGSDAEEDAPSEPAEAWLRLLDPPDPDGPECLGRLGVYEVSRVIGQGGMGVVLKARDPALDRTVAIKLLNPTLAHGPSARRRFAREARAAAAVAHEHIVAIYAVDEFRGLPYLVMQYIGGRSLQERLDATGPLTVLEILRVGTQAARALAAAHAQGVVHRDIKPANILLENCVERVKLTDFGLARAVDDASLTMSGVIAGTPQYMAPEQARGEPVDARSDLFSLGAVLYAMAAGRPPFRADSAMAVLKRVCDDRHRPIREVNTEVPAWLAQIIDRLLAKDPKDRFATAAEVADLLERGLAHVQQPTLVDPPVLPGPVHADVRELDFDLPAAKPAPARRRRLALAAWLGLLAICGLGVSDAAGLTQVTDYVATILRIKRPEGTLLVKVDDPGVRISVDGDDLSITGAGPQEIRLRAGRHRVHATRDGRPIRDEVVSITRGQKEIVHIESEPGPPTDVVVAAPAPPAPPGAVVPDITGMNPFAPVRPIPPVNPGPVWSLTFTPDGKQLAIAQQSLDHGPSTLRVWDLDRKADAIRLQEPVGFRSLALSPDGRSLAAVMADGGLRLWRIDGDSPRPIPWHNAEGQPGETVTFLPGTDQPACVLRGGQVIFGNNPDRFLRYPGNVLLSLAVSRDGKLLAVGSKRGLIQVHDVATGMHRFKLEGHDGPVESLDFAPDGKTLASASRDGTVRIWDLANGGKGRILASFRKGYLTVRFSPDGKTLACSDGPPDVPAHERVPCSVQVWDWEDGKLRHALRGHVGSIRALAFSPDGRLLATGSMDQTVRLWDAATGRPLDQFVPGQPTPAPALPPVAPPAGPGPALAPAAVPPPALPPAAPAPVGPAAMPLEPVQASPARRRGLVWSLAFAPDGGRLAIGQQGIDGAPSLLRVWDLRAKRDAIWMTQPAAYRSLAFSSDGRVLGVGTLDGTLAVQENEGDVARPRSGNSTNQGSAINALAFLPGTHHLAFGMWDGRVKIDRGQPLGPAEVEPQYPGKVFGLAVSPDGKTLAVAGEAGTINLHDVESGKLEATLRGHQLPIESLDFSPDGKHLASASWDNTVRIWDVKTCEEVRRLDHSSNKELLAVRFSPDGKFLAVGEGRHDAPHAESFPCPVQLWDWRSRKLVSVLNGHSNSVYAVTFSPDGRLLATGSMDQTVRLWDAATGKPLQTIIPGETGTSADMGTIGAPGGLGATVVPSASAPTIPIDPARTIPPEAVPTPAGPGARRAPAVEDSPTRRPGLVWSLAFTPDGERLAIGQQGINGQPSVLRVWDRKRRQDIILEENPAAWRSVAFAREGPALGAAGTIDGKVFRWKIDERQVHTYSLALMGSAVNAVTFLPGTPFPVLGLSGGMVWYDPDRGVAPDQVLGGRKSEVYLEYPGKILALAASPDGKLLAFAGESGMIFVHDVMSHERVGTYGGLDAAVESLDFSPDGKTLALALRDGTVRLLEVGKGGGFPTLAQSPDEYLAVRFSPDGKTLACATGKHGTPHSVSFPCVIQIWDWRDGKCLFTLEGHTSSIPALAFAPDGKTLASGSLDTSVRLWDPANGKLLEKIIPGVAGAIAGKGATLMQGEFGAPVPLAPGEHGSKINRGTRGQNEN